MITLAVLALWRFTLVACCPPNRPKWIHNLTSKTTVASSRHGNRQTAAEPSSALVTGAGAGAGGSNTTRHPGRHNNNGGGGGGGTGGAGACSARDAMVVIFLIWLFAFGVTLPPLFGWGHYGLEGAHFR